MKEVSSGVEGAMEEESLEPGDMGVETGLQSDMPYLSSMSRIYCFCEREMVLEGLSLSILIPRSWEVGPRSLSLKWEESSWMKAWMADLDLQMMVMSSTNTGMMILRESLRKTFSGEVGG
jgi:hypothetical protein